MTTQDWIVPLCRTFAVELVASEEEDRFSAPVIRVHPYVYGTEPVHTEDHPFCQDETCGCHYNEELFNEAVYLPVENGLMTFSEANALRWGETI